MIDGKPWEEARLDEAVAASMPLLQREHRMDTEAQEEAQFRLFYRAVLRQLPELELTDRDADRLARDKVFRDENILFYKDALPVLTELKKRYKLGVISDTWPSAKRLLRSAGLYGLFDSLTFSFRLGVFKPDERMYRHALSELGLPPERTVFVDDSPACLEGAKRVDITPIQIQRISETPQYAELRIHELSELPALLEQLEA